MNEQPLHPAGWGTLLALAAVIGVSGWLGLMAERATQKGSFLKGFFLGNRGLGVWALALTATVQSGGTFMGFPSLVYTHGWVVTLWIASYMVGPLTSFTILAKRFAQMSRRLGAVTAPDLFRGRFDSPRVGLVVTLLILFSLMGMMIAQFKAGALVMKISLPNSDSLALAEELQDGQVDWAYFLGLAVFSVTVVGYTMVGGFLASVWTDLFQSVLMLIGVLLLLVLVLVKVGGLEQATTKAVANTNSAYALAPGYSPQVKSSTTGEMVESSPFMPIGIAFSMFLVWTFGGVTSPASMVRVMASKNTETVRRSIFVLCIYNLLIYLPIIFIAIAARSVFANLTSSDEVIPRIALWATSEMTGGPLITGLILAAPFGAVMATVSTFLVVITSGLVHDVYQRFINPDASEKTLRSMTYVVMVCVGLLSVGACIDPPQYLQKIIVFCTSVATAAFLTPALMAAFWRRATAAGAITAMLVGAGTIALMSILGVFLPQGPKYELYNLLGIQPIFWGIVFSAVSGVTVCFFTKPPREEVLSLLFDAPKV